MPSPNVPEPTDLSPNTACVDPLEPTVTPVDLVEPCSGASKRPLLDELVLELGRLQRKARVQGLPVILLVDGWEASGKGTLIGKLALALDPRGFRVVTRPTDQTELRRQSPLARYWKELPIAGEFLIVDRSYYSELWRRFSRKPKVVGNLGEEISTLLAFERTLMANGCLVVKCFIDIDKSEQARRFRKLLNNQHTSWRIDERDLHEQRHYKRYQKVILSIIEETSASVHPIRIVQGRKRSRAFEEVLQLLVEAVSKALVEKASAADEAGDPVERMSRYSIGKSPLDAVDLTQSLDRCVYEERLPVLQKRLRDLEHRIYRERIPVVMLFEGWDAAGKGGAIRRLVAGLDPRGYEVVPISAPSETERNHHYLWRFARRIQRPGHITLFDRSWYGRVLVERVEGFCSNTAWQRAYSEIGAFEEDLVSHGAVLIKYWFQIDQATQLARFEARQASQDKSWKITEEDWRNRAKWAAYETALVDTLTLTSSTTCPWTVVPANDKLLARVMTLETAIAAIERQLAPAASAKL